MIEPECTCIPGAYSQRHESCCAIVEAGDPVVITEVDVLDELTVWVQCEDCDYSAPVADMHYHSSGAWLCDRCWRRAQADAEDVYRTARGDYDGPPRA